LRRRIERDLHFFAGHDFMGPRERERAIFPCIANGSISAGSKKKPRATAGLFLEARGAIS
jgi:hypothetical protein